jgi:hypothetical protein
MKKFLLVLLICGTVGATQAQEISTNSNAFLMFLHAGWGKLPDKTSGLTNSSAVYVNELCSGVEWNLQAYFKSRKLITGLLYSGYTANGKLKNTSDKILTTYIAPQLGMNIPIGGEIFDIAFNAGIGGMWYRNNSLVFGKDRIAKGRTVGINLGVKGIYNFTQSFGVSFEIATIRANLYKTKITYHDETIKVTYPEALHLNQITFSIGLKYSLKN